jgi:hypothetical protein
MPTISTQVYRSQVSGRPLGLDEGWAVARLVETAAAYEWELVAVVSALRCPLGPVSPKPT